MKDVLGLAIWDYYFEASPKKLWIHNTYGPKEEMPVAVYFRVIQDMPPLELRALQQCKGAVLDIGAGAGSHALLLQQKGMKVTALEISPKAVEVMKARGVINILNEDIFQYKGGYFDTLLLLMNGIGLTGTLEKLHSFLQHAKTLLNKKGQLLFDSSNIAYLYEGNLPDGENYYGEILYQYEYKKQKSEWFKWLYIDKRTLQQIAIAEGWETEILFEDEYDQYLARLTVKDKP